MSVRKIKYGLFEFGFGDIGGLIKDAGLGVATGGIYPSVKYGKKIASGVGGFLGLKPHNLPEDAFKNPYSAKQRSVDTARSNYYNKQAVGAFGGMNTAGKNINRNAAGYGGLISRLSDMGKGVGPSLAQMQLEQATNRNIKNQAGIFASNQGYNPAMAARLMSQNVAGMNQEAAGQSGQLRLQEQMDAMNQEIAARQAQGQAYGMAGNLYGNQAQLGLAGSTNYQNMAEQLAENDRAAQIALAQGNQAAYQQAMGRRLGFISKLGQAVGAVATGGASAGAAGGASMAGNPYISGNVA